MQPVLSGNHEDRVHFKTRLEPLPPGVPREVPGFGKQTGIQPHFDFPARIAADDPVGKKLAAPEKERKSPAHHTGLVCHDPGTKEGVTIFGEVAFHQERFEEAVSHYRRAAELDPNPVSLQGLANAYWEIGERDSTVQILARAIEVDDSYAPIHFSLSAIAEELQDLDKA